RNVGVTAHVDDRQLRVALDERVVHIEAGQMRHAHVEHQTGRLPTVARRQRFDGFARISPRLHVVARTFQPELCGLEELGIVVDDVDGASAHGGLYLAVDSDLAVSRGRLTWKVAPRSTLRLNHKRPWCSSTKERQIERPIPMPEGLLEANGTKSFAAA